MTTRPPCHCLCTVAHPEQPGICHADRAVCTRRVESRLLGPVDAPLCFPCATQHGPPGDEAVNLWMLIRPSLAAAIAAATT